MKKPDFKNGDLIKVIETDGWTACTLASLPPDEIRECPVGDLNIYANPQRRDKLYNSLEGKVGLIVYVKRNLLMQPVGYRVLIEGNEMFCKSKVAQKYFELLETPNHESRRFS